jgi:hypothetical protein
MVLIATAMWKPEVSFVSTAEEKFTCIPWKIICIPNRSLRVCGARAIGVHGSGIIGAAA